MVADQQVSLPTNTMNDFQLTGKQIEEALKDPKSQLYQDLYNARINALTNKKALRKIQYQSHAAQKIQQELDALENELAKQLELARIQNRDDLARYYAEQHKLAMQEVALLVPPVLTIPSAALLSDYAKALIATEAQLYFLKNQRTTILHNYAKNQRDYARAFINALDKQFDISTLPEAEQIEIRKTDKEVIERMTKRKPFAEALTVLGADHPMNQMLKTAENSDLYDARRRFHNNVLASITLQQSIVIRRGRNILVEEITVTAAVSSYQDNTSKYDNELAQNTIAIAITLEKRNLLLQQRTVNNELHVEMESVRQPAKAGVLSQKQASANNKVQAVMEEPVHHQSIRCGA